MPTVERLRSRCRRARDEGFTLVEVLVAMVVTAISLVLIVPIFSSVTEVYANSNSSANASGQARNVLRQVAADVSSSNSNNVCFPTAAQAVTTTMPTCDPNIIEIPIPNTTPVVYTKPTTGQYLRVLSNVDNTCQWIQWSVDPTTQKLVQQTWPKSSATEPSGWASPVSLVGYVAPNVDGQNLFTLDTSGLLVTVEVTLQGSVGNSANGTDFSTAHGSQAVELSSSVGLVKSSQPQGSC